MYASGHSDVGRRRDELRGALARLAGGLVVVMLVGGGCLAGSAQASPQWQTLAPSAVVPDRSEVSSAAFDREGRAVVTVRDPSGFATYERSSGRMSLVRRAVAGDATNQGTAVLDEAGRTVVVWHDDSAVHARSRSGDADFGPVVDLPGSSVGPDVDAAALTDGSVVVAQPSRSETHMRIWRRAADSTAFTLVADAAMPSGERTTWDRPVVRAGPNGAAVVLFTTSTPVFGFGTETRRGRIFMLSGTTVSPLETAFEWSFEFNLFNGGTTFFTRSDDAAFLADGTIVASAMLYLDRASAGRREVFLARRSPQGTWTGSGRLDGFEWSSANANKGMLETVDLVPAGAAAFGIYGRRAATVTGQPTPPLNAMVARVTSTSFGAPVIALGTTAAPNAGSVHTGLVRAGTPLVLMTRDNTLSSQALTSAGAAEGVPQTVLDGGPLKSTALGAGDGSASGIAAALRGAPGDLRLVVSLLDGEAPSLAINGPATVTTNTPVTLTSTVSDREDADVTVSWDTDPELREGPTAQVAYASPGTRTIRATATDDAGNSTVVTRTIDVVDPPPPPAEPELPAAPQPPAGFAPPGALATNGPGAPAGDAAALGGGGSPAGGGPATGGEGRRAPVLSQLVLAPARLRPGRSSTLHWRSSAAATILVRVERWSRGFRSGGRCVARRPVRTDGRRTRSCTRVERVGTWRGSTGAGSGQMPITGRIAGRRLPRGTYRLTAVAVDATGARSEATTLRLVVMG
jgi:hypothetical protein